MTDATLPASDRALRALADGFTWNVALVDAQASSEARAWKITYAALAVAVLGFGGWAFQTSRPLPAPVPVVVDRTTGASMVVGRFDESSVPQLEVVDKHWASVFVRSCESYFFNMLKRDYEQCGRMSTPGIFRPYAAKYSGENAMQTKVGTTQEHSVTIIGVRLASDAQPGRRGEAIVTFDKEIRSTQGQPTMVTRYVATLGYEYRPKSMKEGVDQNENPFGFVVTSYRPDAELVTPGPVAAVAQ